MKSAHIRPSVRRGAHAGPRPPSSAATWRAWAGVCQPPWGLSAPPAVQGVGVSLAQEPPGVAGSVGPRRASGKTAPSRWLLEGRRQRRYPFKRATLGPPPSSRTLTPGRLRQTRSFLRGGRDLAHFLYVVLGGRTVCLS